MFHKRTDLRSLWILSSLCFVPTEMSVVFKTVVTSVRYKHWRVLNKLQVSAVRAQIGLWTSRNQRGLFSKHKLTLFVTKELFLVVRKMKKREITAEAFKWH